jgi:membrane carboxypeptidase/penicillin-binding protein PbpC
VSVYQRLLARIRPACHAIRSISGRIGRAMFGQIAWRAPPWLAWAASRVETAARAASAQARRKPQQTAILAGVTLLCWEVPLPAPASCQLTVSGGQAPHINSPLSNTTYTLRAARVMSETIPLAATADGEVRTVHWFVDDAYVGTSQLDVAVTWTPGRSGEFTVRAVDDQGRVDSRDLRVGIVP